MIKSIIKEIIIMLLLCIAIILILGILFYDYIPTNKIVPTKEAYTTPENVKEEIDEEITELKKTVVSYEVTGSDLNLYKQSNSYIPGKDNPFALVSTNTNTDGNSTGNPTTGGNNAEGQSGGGNSNGNSTGTFFNDVK